MEKVKNKVRFTSLDVAGMVNDLQMLVGLRVTNIYDINPSTYLLKFSKSEEKHYLLIENGVRFHTTTEKGDKKIPSGFTMKFRKYLRSKRLENIRQVGVERVVVLTFGSDIYTNHLILQLYAQGNIILTDNAYRIIQCIRSHEFKQGVKTAVGEIYPFQHAAHIYLQTINLQQQSVLKSLDTVEIEQQVTEKKKKKNKNDNKLKDVVFKAIPCLFPLAIEHILISAGVNPEQKVDKTKIDIIMNALHISMEFLNKFMQTKQKGYIFYKEVETVEKEENTQKKIQKLYFEFTPYLNAKYVNQKYPYITTKTFNEAVNDYYEHIAKNIGNNHLNEGEEFEQIAWKKYDQIKKDQQDRIEKLKEEQEECKIKAEYIQKNIEDVDIIIKIVKTMEDNGYSWQNIDRMISESKHNGDPYANMIHGLDIAKRQVIVLLGDPTAQEQHFQLIPVQIDIDYNAYTNATIYYESKKKTGQKEKRTKQASEQVLKIAEKDAMKKIQKKKNQQLAKNIPVRKSFWFEKFYWFISSEGYLVISGRDSHQNQLLVKRYMKNGDLYMHSDYGGAASTVIKNPEKLMAVPRGTLEQAAIFTVCRSKAWQTKIISGAWWVHHQQVSKSAPTGEFLPTGSFMIRGKRNFIYPNRMEMGLTFLYKIDQDSVQRHLGDRKAHLSEQKNITQNVKIQQSFDKGEEEYAIINLEANNEPKKKQQKGTKPQQNKKQQKIQTVKPQKKEVDSQDQQNSEQEQDDENQKSNIPKKQNITNQKKNVNNVPQQPKQRMKNKRKIKKLQKYLEQQDEEQRQIIMKMIGARQMKHMREEDYEDHKKKDKKVKTKKGIQKYIEGEQQHIQENKLDPEKVLFLKGKNQQKPRQYQKNKKQQKQQKQLIQKTGKQIIQKQQSNSQIKIKQKQQQVTKEQNKFVKNQQKQSIQNIVKQDKKQQEEEVKNNQQKSENSDESQQEDQKQIEEKKVEVQQQIDQKVIDSQFAQLLKLVGNVHPNDHYQNLVAMCAPYQTIAENRFKVKLVPGGLKKGKAARNITHYFLQNGDLNEIEKPLLKGLPEQEVINCMVGNVKLAGAGLLKLQMKEKAEKKMKRKQTDKKK